LDSFSGALFHMLKFQRATIAVDPFRYGFHQPSGATPTALPSTVRRFEVASTALLANKSEGKQRVGLLCVCHA
jgi:hypothetical protein